MKPGTTLRVNVTDMRNGRSRALEYHRLPITIGRHETNGLQCEDATVSRVHATIEWDGAELVLCDLGSCNGTYVKGLRVAPYSLRRLGWEFTFSIGPFVVHGSVEEIRVESCDAETRVLTERERALLRAEDAAITVVRRLA